MVNDNWNQSIFHASNYITEDINRNNSYIQNNDFSILNNINI